MLTISQTLRSVLRKYPAYAEALGHGIVNYRSLARVLRKEIEDARMQTVSQEAIAIALRREAAACCAKIARDRSVHPAKTLSIRSDMSLFLFEHSPELPKIHQKLLRELESHDGEFLHCTQGMRDTTFVVSDPLAPRLLALAEGESLIRRYRSCSLVTVMLPRESIDYSGVCERYFRALAWEEVNVMDFILSNTELSFLVQEADAERAYDVVRALGKG